MAIPNLNDVPDLQPVVPGTYACRIFTANERTADSGFTTINLGSQTWTCCARCMTLLCFNTLYHKAQEDGVDLEARLRHSGPAFNKSCRGEESPSLSQQASKSVIAWAS